MRWLQFIFSHSLFISLCAAAMCVQTYVVCSIAVDSRVCLFVFFSTLASYNFYWLISKFAFNQRSAVQTFIKKERSYVLLFLTAAAFVCFYALQLPYMWGWALFGALLTLLYSMPLWPLPFLQQLPKPGFLKTVLLAFTWAYVITVLPLAAALTEHTWEVAFLFLNRFFFMLMLCIIFDMRDATVDKLHSLKSLATSVSKRWLQNIVLMSFSLYLFAGICLWVYFSSTQQLVAFLLTGAVLWWVYRLSLLKQGYLFYYFGVDGLMLFSSLATIVAHWL
jgi:4-hydroxybenzoate polyprenyltransferase